MNLLEEEKGAALPPLASTTNKSDTTKASTFINIIPHALVFTLNLFLPFSFTFSFPLFFSSSSSFRPVVNDIPVITQVVVQ